MSKLNAIILSMAARAKQGKPVKRTLSNGAEIGFLIRKDRTAFFLRRPTDNRAKTELPSDAFCREAITFKNQAEQGGDLKLAQPTYGRTATALFALLEVIQWPGEGPVQEILAGVGRSGEQ